MGNDAAVIEKEVVKVATATKKKAETTGNLFADVAAQVENLSKAKALSLADQLANDIENNEFRLGGVLKVIRENGWFEGYESFEMFVAERYGFQIRKAKYLMRIYTELVTKEIAWESVAHLGWTKVKEIAKHVTKDNLAQMVAMAEAMSVLQLQAALKAQFNDGEEPADTKTTDDLKVVKFNLHSDQRETLRAALDKAKKEGHTEFDAVALEFICMGYLGGSSQVAPLDLTGAMEKAGVQAVFDAISKVFPDLNVTVEQ